MFMAEINEIKNNFLKELSLVSDERELDELRVKYLGRNGELTKELKTLGGLLMEEKKKKGADLNNLKKIISEKLEEKKKEALKGESVENAFDITAPGAKFEKGSLHPVSIIFEEMFSIFKKLGFSIADGPEVESDWYNFQALNFPKDHPVRDTQDTFFIDDEVVLRTHTSPVQIRYMEKSKPPIRIIVPGRVYRRDSDVTHTPMFHQLEGLVVDENVSFSDLKGTLEYFVRELYGKDRKLRFRPHHFPFTEPSAEVDVSCGICAGKGCRSCKYSGWLEILGAGMVHPNVLMNSGIDPEKYTGFAFGLGIDRIAMLKYNIDDLRLLYEGDLRFNKQF